MKIQIGSSEYNCSQIKSISRSSGQTPGLNELAVTIELDYGQDLPLPPKLLSCVLSEGTGTPLKFFPGWYLGKPAKPTQHGEKILFTLRTAGVLYYLDKGKPIANFSTNGTLEQVVINTALEAELTKESGLKYLLISAGGDNPETTYSINNAVENFSKFLTDITSAYGYEAHVQELGWLDVPTLLESSGAITGLKLLPIGSTDLPSPITEATYDPTDPDNCATFPFTDFEFDRGTKSYTTVEVVGKLGELAKELDEGPQTSYSKYLTFALPKAVDNPGVTDAEFSIELPKTINKLNQVLILPELGQLELVEPYDPETPLTGNTFYFDPQVPRIILSNALIASLTDPDNVGLGLVNYVFIRVRHTDSGASSNLSAATGGALEKAYIVLNDQNINDFGVATETAINLLSSYLNGGFTCQGKRRTTTENWVNGQSMTINIPAYSVSKVVKVVGSSASYKGKIEVSGVERDEVIFDLRFAEVVNPKGSGFAGATRNGLSGASGGSSNKPNLPTYEHIPFVTGDMCLVLTWTGGGVIASTGTVGTGSGFEILAEDFINTSTGTFTTTVELDEPGDYVLRFIIRSDLITGEGTTDLGQLQIKLNGVVQDFDYFQGFPTAVFDGGYPIRANSGDEGDLYNVATLTCSLTEAIAGENTLVIEYNQEDNWLEDATVESGTFEVSAIRICKVSFGPTPAAEGVNGQHIILTTQNGTVEDTVNVTLVDLNSDLPDFYGGFIYVQLLGSPETFSYTVNLYINDELQATLLHTSSDKLLYEFDLILAGENVDIKMELIASQTGEFIDDIQAELYLIAV